MSSQLASYQSIHSTRLNYIKSQISRLNLPSGSKILDVGCYPTLLFDHLSGQFDVWGISSPHEPVNHPKIKILNLDSEPIPFPSKSFDLIIMSEVIEHLYRQVPLVLSRLHQLLKPQGVLLLTTPNAVNLLNLTKVIFLRNPAYPLSDLSKDNLQTGTIYHRHNREYTYYEIITLLNQTGFSQIKGSYFSAYTPWRSHIKSRPKIHQLLGWIFYLSTLILPSRRDSLFFLASK